MALPNSQPGTVDILNHQTGEVISQYSQNADRAVNLTRTSLVRINARPEVVNFYQRQGEDLIVHMQDGSIVHYQNFFSLDEAGLHSELVFQDEEGLHQALFPFAGEAGPAVAETAVPTFAATSADALIGDVGLTAAAGATELSGATILGGLAGVGAIAGGALAASNSRGDDNDNPGSGDDNNNADGDDNDTDGGDNNGDNDAEPPVVIPPLVSTLLVDAISGDNIINALERTQDLLLSGRTGAGNAGLQLRVTLGDNSYSTLVNEDGSFNFTLPAAALQALNEGSNALDMTLVDVNGQNISQRVELTLDTVAPILQLTDFASGGVLDADQAASDKLVTGVSSPEDAGQTVTLTLNNQTYTTIVGTDGNWQVTIPAADLQTLLDGEQYTLDISLSDTAGNVTTASQDFSVAFDSPMLTINALGGDNQLNKMDLLLPQMISGDTQNIPVDSLVRLSFGPRLYFARVLSNGSWNATIPAADLQEMDDGQVTLFATAILPDNSEVDISTGISIDRTQPDIAIAILSTDDYLNAAEATQPLEVRGITNLTLPGATVQVSLNDKVYNALVDSAGHWSVIIPPEDLALLPDGPREVTATVVLNELSAEDVRTLNVLINNLPQPVLDTPFGDELLSATDLQQDQLLSGNTGVTGDRQSVTLQIGGLSYLASVDRDGNWSLTIPGGQLQNLPQGVLPVVVVATDAAGNSATTMINATLDTTPPLLSLLPLTSDAQLNASELTTTQTLSGLSSETGQTVTVTLNDQTYTAVVGGDGRWQLDLPPEALASLTTGDYLLLASLSDQAGNFTETSQLLSVKTTQPGLIVKPLTNDNLLDGAEIKTAQYLSGSVTDAAPGSTVQLSAGDWSQSVTVDVNGNWRLEVPVSVLQTLTEGVNNLQLSITDTYNQSSILNYPVTVDTTSNAVAISIIANDDYLNRSEAQAPLLIQGTSAGLPVGSLVSIAFSGLNDTFFATIDASGNWQTEIPSSFLQGLTDDSYSVQATAQSADGTVTDLHTLTVIINNLPAPAADPLFGDGTLNLVEASQNQLLTGNTGSTGAGQQVSITLGNQTYQGTVDAEGNWRVTLPSGALDNLSEAQSPVALQLSVSDIAGNTAIADLSFNIDQSPPQLSVDPFAGDGYLNIAEAAADQILSGTAAGAEPGSTVEVAVNGTALYGNVSGPNGEWQIIVPSEVLQGLPNGQVLFNVTVTDSAGNSASASHRVNVVTDVARQPVITLNPVTSNNIIDANERDAGVTLTGVTHYVEAGQQVTVTLGEQSWNGVVDAAGNWSISIPAGALADLSDGGYTLSASVSDLAGNSATGNRGFSVDIDRSAITVAPLTGDDLVGVSDIADGLTVSGSSANIAAQTLLIVTLNGRQYTTNVQEDGSWNLTVPQADALQIRDGTVSLSATALDEAGNAIYSLHDFTLITRATPVASLNPAFGDGILNAAEAANGATLAGSTGVSGSGQTVVVQLGQTSWQASVDASGNWSLIFPAAALQNLEDGSQPLLITASDVVGNQSVLQHSLLVDKTPPTLTIDHLTSDNIINSSEALQPLQLSGTASYDPDRPQQVIVQLNGQTYSALVLSDNSWSVTLPAGALSGALDGPVTITASTSDFAGNSVTAKSSFTLDASPLNAPTLQVNPITGDDYLNASEAGQPFTITGTSQRVEAGQNVTVTLNGQNYQGSVQPDGSWSVTLPPQAVTSAPDGTLPIEIEVSDVAGNLATVSRPVTLVAQPASQPRLTVDVIAQDDVLNALEQGADLTISGTAQNLGLGTLVTISVNNLTYTGSVAANGLWSATIPASALAGLSDDTRYTLSVTASDAAQNIAGATRELLVDTTGPTVSVAPGSVFDDGLLNVSESAVDQLLSGNTVPGASLVLLANGQPIASATTADNNGDWTLVIPAAQLQALPAGNQTLTLQTTSPQGNISTTPINLEVGNSELPVLTLDPPFGDNLMNSSELQQGGVLSGSASGLAAGTPVTVSLGDLSFSGLVGADGSWTANVSSAALQGLANGQYSLTIAAADRFGNPASASATLEVLAATPQAILPTPLFSDGLLNASEAGAGQILSGSSGLTGAGQSVFISVDGGAPVSGSVNSAGHWTVALPPAVLSALADGSHTLVVTLSDRAGNSASSAPENFTSLLSPLPQPSLDGPLFGDDVLTAAEAGSNYQFTLNTGVSDPGRPLSVSATLNNGTPLAVVDNGDGSWSVTLPSDQLMALPDGEIPLNLVVSDAAGNSISLTESFTAVINNVPNLTVNQPFGDLVLTSAEASAAAGQIISGNTGASGDNQTLTLTLSYNDIVWSQTLTPALNGDWAVTIPASVLGALPSGRAPTINVTASDLAGNTSSIEPIAFTVQTTLPTPTINPLFTDNILNIAEAAGETTISGNTGLSGQNQYVTVTIDVNGTTYVANVDNNGAWSLALPAGTLEGLTSGAQVPVSVTAQDQYGNSASIVPLPSFLVAFTPTAVALNPALTPALADGYLNIAEVQGAITLGGSYATPVSGATDVVVTIGGQDFTATAANGSWSLTLPAGSLSGIASGLQAINVTATDAAGNSGNVSLPVTFAVDAPTVSINTPFVDGVLDWAESQQTQIISGTTTNVNPGQMVRVTLFGGSFTTLVQADGSWAFRLTPQQLDALDITDTRLVASVSDAAGNAATSPTLTVGTNLTPPSYEVVINPPGGDGILNASDLSATTITLSGNSAGLAGQPLSIAVNDTPVGNVTVNQDGSWSLQVPRSTFPNDGSYILTASSASPPLSSSETLIIDTLAPQGLIINTLAGNDILNASEADAPLVINGHVAASEAGRPLTVTLNGVSYYTSVNPDGSWSATVPPGAVSALDSQDYTITATLSDEAGNVAQANRVLTVDIDPPLLTVDALGVPAVLNTVNAAGGLLLQGTGEPGNQVTLTLGPLSWSGTVDQNGNWQHAFPLLDLTTLTDGAQVVSISSTDAAGNSSVNRVALNVALNKGLGVLVDDLFGGDGILNVAESLVTQVVTGRIEGDYRGATVTASIVGSEVTLPLAPVLAGDGSFSVAFPPSLWQGLIDNTLQLNLNVTDAFGNTTNRIIDFDLALRDLPVVNEVVVGVDNLINQLDSATSQTISGTLSNVEDVASVVVLVAGQALNALVDNLNGTWRAELPATLFNALPDGDTALQVRVTDTAGNLITQDSSFRLALTPPTLGISALFGDGILNIAELISGVINGTSSGLAAGQQVSIRIADAPVFTASVGNDGRWSASLPSVVQGILQTIKSGELPLSVTATDAYGNSTALDSALTLNLLTPVLNINTLSLFGDGLLNAADALVSQTISGSVGQAAAGSSVAVTVGNQTWNGTVGADGLFAIQVSPSQLLALTDGTLTSRVTITTPEGNTTTSDGPLLRVGIASLPTLSVNPLFGGDGWLNASEATLGQTISGTSNLASGTVAVQIGTSTLTGSITNGVWSVSVSPTLLQNLSNGALPVTISVTDAVGNTTSSNQLVNAIVQSLPQLTVNPLFGDNILSLSDLLNPQVLSGTASNLVPGTRVNVALGTLNLTTSVGTDGTWQVPVDTGLLQGLRDGRFNVAVTAVDPAGNQATTGVDLNVSIGSPPSLKITSLFGDNGLNASDILTAQVISGTSSNAVGSRVNLTLGGRSYSTTVANDGSWQVTVPKTDLGSLLDGTLTVNASLTNPAGNTTSTSGVLNVITHALPSVSLTSLFGNDGYLNLSEANGGQTLSGKISGPVDGASVVVTLGGKAYNAAIAADGSWSLPLASSVLQGLSAGALKVGVAVTDKVGNLNSTSADITVKLTTPTLTFNPLVSLNPLTLLSKGLTLSGGSSHLAPGSIVHLSLLNGTVNTTALTDSRGNWSTTLGLGLSLLELLSLSSVVNIYARDEAGNLGYLNVGLGGQIISASPTAAASSLALETDHAAFALLSEDNARHGVSPQPTSGENPPSLSPERQHTETITRSAEAEGSYTIGGVTLDLANGSQISGEAVQGSSGDDLIHLTALGFNLVDGGAGTDTLVLDGVNLVLNLADMAGRLQGIEILDLGSAGSNSLVLGLEQALTLTDNPEDDLIIKGGTGNRVELLSSSEDIWQLSGQREVNGLQFDVYHHSAQLNTLGDILIQQGVHIVHA